MQAKSRAQIVREKRRFWQAHIQAWQRSGYSLAAYGKHHNLVYHRLIYWKSKFENEQTKPLSFVPVSLHPDPPDTPLTLSLQNNRFKIEIGAGFSGNLLGRLITTLESL
jgi:transposase